MKRKFFSTSLVTTGSPEEGRKVGKEYPHKKSTLTKPVLCTKLKNTGINFRQAVATARQSGFGRVVLLYNITANTHNLLSMMCFN